MLQHLFRQLYRFSSTAAKERLQTLYSIQREKGWSKVCKKVPLCPANQAALKHFDLYYTHIFGATTWSGIRVALLTPPAKAAVLNAVNPTLRECIDFFLSKNYMNVFNELTKPVEISHYSPVQSITPPISDEAELIFPNRHFLVREDVASDQLSEFVPATELIGEKEIYTRDSDRGFVLQSDSDLMMAKTVDLPVVKEDTNWVETFKNVNCFALPTGVFTELPRPKNNGDCFDFYPLDLGSVLVVLMLDIQPETQMLDLCSAPGGKAVTALQTLNLKRLVCTDVSSTRLDRLRNVLNGFAWGTGRDRPGIPDVEMYTVSSLLSNIRRRNGQRFSRVLVDVPCSTDRDALTSKLGGYFGRGKASVRIALPEVQKRLLRQAMSLCEVGGYIVYSTCTLSVAQNQGVVESCLSTPDPTGHSSADGSFAVVDPSDFIIRCMAQLNPSLGVRISPALRWGDGGPLGALVIPRLAANYGPTFMCKIKRLK